MFDVKAVEAEARKEVAAERGEAAKAKIKSALKEIEAAEKVLANAKLRYELVLRDIGA